MKGLIKMALGVAAGYSVGRVIEAKAQGVSLAEAFSLKDGITGLLTPVSRLRLAPAPVVDVTPRS